MSENKPGYWQSLLRSFDPKFYANILDQSFGRSFVYIMLLSFIVSFFLALTIKIEYNKFASRASIWIERHIDEIWPKGIAEVKIDNGQVSSEAKQPFIHKWNDIVLILDTTGAINSLNDYRNGILILKDKIIVKNRKSGYESRLKEYDLSWVDKFVIRAGDINKGIIAEIKTKDRLLNITLKLIKFWIKFIGEFIFVAMLLVLFLFYLAAKMAQGAFFALLSLIPNRITGANLNYAKLLNISLYAFTPGTIFAVILTTAHIKLPSFWVLYSFIYMSYIMLAIKNIKDSNTEISKTPFITGGDNVRH